MSPILVRPVREQLEHDRLIRFLHANKDKRKLEVTANVGDERVASVKIGAGTFFPDLVIMDGKKLAGLVEVETGESVNNLEALAEWVHFSKARAPFHLYVPVTSYDTARRLCDVHHLHPAEIWTYRPAIDGFDLVRVHHTPHAGASSRESASAPKMPKTPKTTNGEKPAPKAAAATPPIGQSGNGKAGPSQASTAKPVKIVKNGKSARPAKKPAKPAKPVKPAKAAPARSVKAARPSKAKKTKR